MPGTERLRVAQSGGVARLTLDRPERRNALDAPLIEDLKSALRAADADPEVRVVALEGRGRTSALVPTSARCG